MNFKGGRGLKSGLLIAALAVMWCCQVNAQPAIPAAAEPAGSPPASLKDFVRHPEYSYAKISPDGEFLAITALAGKQTVLAVLRLKDMSVISHTRLMGDRSVGTFDWAGPNRLIFSAVMNLGSYAQPFKTGEWFAVNADGSMFRNLIDYEAKDTFTARKLVHYSQSFSLLDALPDDNAKVLMLLSDASNDVSSEMVEVDTFTGKRRMVARAPHGGECSLVPDEHHQPLYATCFSDKGADGAFLEHSELYRWDATGKWTLVNRSTTDGRHLGVLGTAHDGRIYALSGDEKGPVTFGLLDRGTNSFKPLYHDPVVDPFSYIMGSDGKTILGVVTMAGAPHVQIVEPGSPDVAVYVALSKAFPEKFVDFYSATRDGQQILVSASNDTDPGELYLYERSTGSVRFLIRNRSWLDPTTMATVRPFSFKTRDGIEVYGYMTIPHGRDPTKLPMILNPHGGPIGVRDDWGFNGEAQMLASRGYLVVQLNYRGSNGFGRSFENMGHGQWGRKMQNDLTDATHWAVDQGYADPNRICIYGGSYGGYAALMGAASEPDLYRCAVGYVGVYDLPMMFKKGDISETGSGQRYLAHTLGKDDADLRSRSPVFLASHIKVPVFLAAGVRDQRAPKEHTVEMRDALKAAGHPAEAVIFEPDEMHGFYDETANLNLYTKMLAFFDKYIGAPSGVAATAGK
ncbi:MAG: peptidase [Xanthomonadaceae bacterium]|nr:peptidase [Xanthomonadaceae bacterium]